MKSKQWLGERSLQGNVISLHPLQKQHAQALLKAASDGESWNLWYTSIPNKDSINSYIEAALSDKEKGTALPFIVIDNATQEVIGSTRFCNADTVIQRLEIGYTWYAKRCQRTPVNTECKYLLLRYAFEQLAAIAVEFRTH